MSDMSFTAPDRWEEDEEFQIDWGHRRERGGVTVIS
jgi:hypothetical protein